MSITCRVDFRSVGNGLFDSYDRDLNFGLVLQFALVESIGR